MAKESNLKNRYNLYPAVNNSSLSSSERKNVLDYLLNYGAGFLDIETLDTAGGSPIHQVGYFDVEQGFPDTKPWVRNASEYIPAPSARKGGYKWDELDVDPKFTEPIAYGYNDWQEAYKDYPSTFTSKMLEEQRDLWGYLAGDKIASSRNVILNSQSMELNRDIGKPIVNVIEELVKDKFGSKTIWLMNAEFESKMFASHMSPNSIETIKKYQAIEGNTLHDFFKVTDPYVLAARKHADDTGDYSVLWDAVKKSLEEQKKRSGYQILDLQDVLKGFQGYGLKASKAYGLDIDFKDVTRGIKLDIFSHILFGEIEAHSGVEDSELTRRVLNKIGNYSDILASMLTDEGQPLPLTEFTAEQKEAFSVLEKVARTKEVAKDYYAVSHVNRILMDEYKAKAGGHAFTHRMFDTNRTKHVMKKVYKEVKIGPDKYARIPTHISVPILEAQFQIYESVDEALDRLQRMPGNEKINIRTLYGVQRQMAVAAEAAGIDPLELLKAQNDQTGNLLMEAIRKADYKVDMDRYVPNLPKVESPTPVQVEVEDTIKTKRQLEKSLLLNPTESYEKLVGGRQKENYERFIRYLDKGRYPLMAGIATLGAISLVSSFGKTDITPEPIYDTQWDSMQDDPTVTSTRHALTDFGSPYRKEEGQDLPSFRAIREKLFARPTPVYMFGLRIDDRIVDFADRHHLDFQKDEINYLQTQEQLEGYRKNRFFKPTEGVYLTREEYQQLGLTRNKKLKRVNANDFNIEVEDADTILLHPKTGIGKTVSIRMTGIDAPEISHSDEKMAALRFGQSQPYGEEGRQRLEEIISQAKQIDVVYDPKDDTYGRQLGVVVADGLNVNTQLVREGWVKSLPFGKTNTDLISRYRLNHLEDLAATRNLGMWQSSFWQAERQTASPHFRLTNNTLTRLDKLSNMNVAATLTAFELAEEGQLNEINPNALSELKPKVQAMQWPAKKKRPTYKEIKYFNNTNVLATLNYEQVMKDNLISYGDQSGLDNRLGRSAQINDYTKIDSTTFSNSPYSEGYYAVGAQQRKSDQLRKRREYMALQREANGALKNQNKQGMMQNA